MKVCFILPISLLPLKGCAFRCFRQAKALANKRVQVIILSPKIKDIEKRKNFLAEVSPYIRILDILPSTGVSYKREFITLLTSGFFISKVLRLESPDIVHVHNPPDTMAAVASIIVLRNNIPIVYDINDLGPESIESYIGKSKFYKKIFTKIAKLLEQAVLKRINGVIVVSESVKQHILQTRNIVKKRNIPITVMYNTVDIYYKNKTSDIEKNEKYILYVGTLSSGFLGLEDFILNLKDTIQKFNIKFKIIGDGPLRVKLEKLVNDLGMKDFIKILGYLDPAEVIKQIQGALICVVPYKRTVLTEITVPTKIFEFMAFGKPIISPALSGFDEVLGKNYAGRYEPDNIRGLISAIEVLLINRDELKRAGEENLRRFQAYTYQKEFFKMMKLYNQILD